MSTQRRRGSYGFTPLEKAAEFIQQSLLYKADGDLMPPYSLRGRSSLTGFTLLELLIAVIMILIAVIIALPQIIAFKNETKQVRVEGDLRAIQTAVESYYISKREIQADWVNIYPETSDTICETYLLSSSPLMTRTAGPVIIKEVLYDPFAGKGDMAEYRYVLSANRQYYVIFSAGMDREYDIKEINNNGEITLTSEAPRDDLYVTNGIRLW
ncbi:MAG: type II secretion system protein [Candidatus Omnitrophota bacterium]